MSVAGHPHWKRPVFNGLLPPPRPPHWKPKRSLEGPDAQHAPVPHPSQRQRPPDSYWPPNEPSLQNETPRAGMPFYMVGPQQQGQQQIQHDFSLGAVGQAAPPPLEAEIMGLADPATAARKRAEMAAKLDRLSPNTIKALLLEASLRHFTVADQVGLEHDRVATLGPHVGAPVAPNNYNQSTYTWAYPQPAPLAAPAPPPPPSPPPPPRRKPSVNFIHYQSDSLREIMRLAKRASSYHYEMAFEVHENIGNMFNHMSASIDENDAFSTKASALRTMLFIWDNCLGNWNNEIGKKLRNECDEWLPHMRLVMGTLDNQDFLHLAYDVVESRSESRWWDYANRTREAAEGCNPILADGLRRAIHKVRFEAGLEEDEYEEEDKEEEDGEEDGEEEEEEPSITAARPAYASAGCTRAQPVVLD